MSKNRQNSGLPEGTGFLAPEIVPGKKRPEGMQVTAGAAPAIVHSSEPAPGNDQPIVLYFQQEASVQSLLATLESHPRSEVFQAQSAFPGTACVLITASEFLLAEHGETLRRPKLRVVALADKPFRDPKADQLVYAYLPEATPLPLIARMIGNAGDHIRLDLKCRISDEHLAGVTREIQELNHIGAALSAEHDTGQLLELILTKSREITASDAGSLYLVETIEEKSSAVPGDHPGSGYIDNMGILRKGGEERVRRMLRFKLAQNDS